MLHLACSNRNNIHCIFPVWSFCGDPLFLLFLEIQCLFLPSRGKKSVKFAFPCVLFAQQATNLEYSRSAFGTLIVKEPFFCFLVPGKTLSASTNCTALGGFESTMHSQFNKLPSEIHEESSLNSGASVRTRNDLLVGS